MAARRCPARGVCSAHYGAYGARVSDPCACLPLLGPCRRCLQLRCTLTQRESAYLTLLETVQELFTQHSPASSSGVVSPAKGSEAGEGEHNAALGCGGSNTHAQPAVAALKASPGSAAHNGGLPSPYPAPAPPAGEQEWEDVGARLQLKLREWQQRLERAAHLSSAERGAADGASAAAWALGSAAGFGSSQQQPAAPGSPASSDGSVCSEDAVSACSSPLACSGASSPASGVAAETAGREGSPVSPRIPAARPLEPAMAAAVAGRPAAGGTPGKGLAGSRIKALGMQAALPAAQKPAAAAAQEPRQA